MTPVEILTLVPLGALVVVFGLFPGLHPRPGRRRRGRAALGRPSRSPSSRDRLGALGPRRRSDRDARDVPIVRGGRHQRMSGARFIVQRSRRHRAVRGRDPRGRRLHRGRPDHAGPRGRRRVVGAGGLAGRPAHDHRRSTPATAFGGSYKVDALTTFLDIAVHRDRRADHRSSRRTTSRRAACRSRSSPRSCVFAMTGRDAARRLGRPAGPVPRPRAHGPARLPAGRLPQDATGTRPRARSSTSCSAPSVARSSCSASPSCGA